MSHLLLVLLFTGFVNAPGQVAPREWLSDYGVALRQAKLERLPLLVVLENPAADASVVQVGSSSEIVETPLLSNYKLCRIDVSTPYGKKVAQAFEVHSFPHTVIIDKTASVQIFKKTGALTAEQWQDALAGHKQGLRRVASLLRTRWFDDETACLT